MTPPRAWLIYLLNELEWELPDLQATHDDAVALWRSLSPRVDAAMQAAGISHGPWMAGRLESMLRFYAVPAFPLERA